MKAATTLERLPAVAIYRPGPRQFEVFFRGQKFASARSLEEAMVIATRLRKSRGKEGVEI